MTALRLFRLEQPQDQTRVEALRHVLRGGELTSSADGSGAKVADVVRGILAQVAEGGDAAAARLTSELDRARVTPSTLRVPEDALIRAHREADPELMAL